jgi:hypothetical protein
VQVAHDHAFSGFIKAREGRNNTAKTKRKHTDREQKTERTEKKEKQREDRQSKMRGREN